MSKTIALAVAALLSLGALNAAIAPAPAPPWRRHQPLTRTRAPGANKTPLIRGAWKLASPRLCAKKAPAMLRRRNTTHHKVDAFSSCAMRGDGAECGRL